MSSAYTHTEKDLDLCLENVGILICINYIFCLSLFLYTCDIIDFNTNYTRTVDWSDSRTNKYKLHKAEWIQVKQQILNVNYTRITYTTMTEYKWYYNERIKVIQQRLNPNDTKANECK